MSEERQLDSPTRISPVRIPGMPQPGATSNETTPPGICAGCGARLLGPAMHRRLAKRLQVRNLSVRQTGTGVAANAAVGRFRAFARW